MSNEHSAGRAPHLWRLRRGGLRSLLKSRGWGIRAEYAEKVIAGRRVTLRAVTEQPDSVVCRVELAGL